MTLLLLEGYRRELSARNLRRELVMPEPRSIALGHVAERPYLRRTVSRKSLTSTAAGGSRETAAPRDEIFTS